MLSRILFLQESTGKWVPLSQRNPADEAGLKVFGFGGRVMEVRYADIPGQSWNQNRMDQFQARVNLALQTRTPIAGLDPSDPASQADPAMDGYYWDGTDLVEQDYAVEDLTYSAQAGLNFTIRKTAYLLSR